MTESTSTTTASKSVQKPISHTMKLAEGHKSEILSEDMLMQLGSKISPLLRMRPWEVIFRINTDGVSLRTFYNNAQKYNPTILLIQDTNGTVFGAVVSEQWQPSKHFYGTGEAFLFTFKVIVLAAKHYLIIE